MFDTGSVRQWKYLGMFGMSGKLYRVACPKFGHPALSSVFYNYALNIEF